MISLVALIEQRVVRGYARAHPHISQRTPPPQPAACVPISMSPTPPSLRNSMSSPLRARGRSLRARALNCAGACLSQHRQPRSVPDPPARTFTRFALPSPQLTSLSCVAQLALMLCRTVHILSEGFAANCRKRSVVAKTNSLRLPGVRPDSHSGRSAGKQTPLLSEEDPPLIRGSMFT